MFLHASLEGFGNRQWSLSNIKATVSMGVQAQHEPLDLELVANKKIYSAVFTNTTRL